MSSKKRLHVTMNSDLHDKLTVMSERYGITTNAFIVFILGRWVDSQYEEQQLMARKVDEMFSSQEDVLENPKILGMIKEILKVDEEFKQNVAKKL